MNSVPHVSRFNEEALSGLERKLRTFGCARPDDLNKLGGSSILYELGGSYYTELGGRSVFLDLGWSVLGGPPRNRGRSYSKPWWTVFRKTWWSCLHETSGRPYSADLVGLPPRNLVFCFYKLWSLYSCPCWLVYELTVVRSCQTLVVNLSTDLDGLYSVNMTWYLGGLLPRTSCLCFKSSLQYF